jgi:hypothetical protein
MTAKDIATLARAARKAGCKTLIQLQLAADLLTREEATLISLSHSIGVGIEAVAHATAGMETAGGIKVVTCREALGFTLARLSPSAQAILGDLVRPEPLRSKNLTTQLGLRYTR